jgi:hypothetical protein
VNATQKFALERDAFERSALGLPPRVFANEAERVKFANEKLSQEAEQKAAGRAAK